MPERQQDGTLRVFLAVTAPLTRARLRQAFAVEPRITLVGDVADAASLVAQIPAADPQFVLCDEYVLADPGVELFARRRPTSAMLRFVLMVPNPDLFTYHGNIPIAASLRLDLTGPETAGRLAPLLEPPPLPVPASVADMEDRFLVVGRGLGSSDVGFDRPPPGTSHRTRPLTPELGVAHPRATVPLHLVARRPPSHAQVELTDNLALVQARLEQHRDAVSGLSSQMALDSALRALQDSACPTAVIVLQLWFVTTSGTVKRRNLDDAALGRAGATLRAVLRQDDLACRLDGTCFAVVMAGLDEQTTPRPVQRIRSALGHAAKHIDLMVASAVGIGYWRPLQATGQPFEQAWHGMLAESALLLG